MTRKEQIEEIDRLLNKYDKSIANAFLGGISEIQSSIVLADIERAIESNNIGLLFSLIDENLVASSLSEFNRELQNAMIAGGDFSSKIARANKIEFGFDITQPSNATFYRDYKADKIRQVTREMSDVVNNIVQRQTISGANPRKTARLIKDNIGLTAKQEQAVSNYRSYLENLERTALQRELRDRRFDPTIRRAINNDKALKQSQIDRMVDRYRQRYVRRRSLNIGRTESLTMVHGGREQYWKEAINQGVVQEGQIKRKWIVTRDGSLRDAHAAIPRMNRDGVGINESFQSPLGMIRYPGDPATTASNRVNCRCSVFTRITTNG